MYIELSVDGDGVPEAVRAGYSKMRDAMTRVRERIDGGELLASFQEGDADIAELVRAGDTIDGQPVVGCGAPAGRTRSSVPAQIGFTPVETSSP